MSTWSRWLRTAEDRGMILALDGKKVVAVDFDQYDARDYVVCKTDVGEHLVSTVLLLFDHSFDPDGPPQIFETLVFPECSLMERCATYDEAVAQHWQMVARVKGGETDG